MSKIRDLVLAYALQNAVFYKGKANPAAVLGKILAGQPELRDKIAALRQQIDDSVSYVNSMPGNKQRSLLKKISPKMLTRPEHQQSGLPGIPGARPGSFVTRFAPSPTGPLNIGQLLRGAMLPYMYAKMYKGKYILRIEDTDPRKIERKYYGMIMEDLMASGLRWDKMVKESDNILVYYKHARQLISAGKAYVCTCDAERFRQMKLRKQACKCRRISRPEHVKRWSAMLRGSYREGEAVVRLRASMSDPNPVMRDPPLLRIIEAPHPLIGKRHRVWPLYNFACAIEDHNLGITHVFRGKEHEHNTAIQDRLYKALGWKRPNVVNFGMVYLPGTKIHTRDMREWVEQGKVSSWDDPALPTVRALLRRGFQPAALERFAITTGITKTDIRVGWENLEGINRKLIDSLANRYMAVIDPVRITIKKAPVTRFALEDLHPDFPARGKKKMPVDLNRVHISRDDWKRLHGKVIRLKGLGNVKLAERSEYKGNEIVAKMPKIQWVSEPSVSVELLTPQGPLTGLGEVNLRKLKPGALVQLERVGFGRIDSMKVNKAVIAFTHK